MKLIVDVPETKYEALKKGATMGMALGVLENVILNGTPVQKGHWVFPNPSTQMICQCSVCGGNGTEFGKDKFCRNCGAEMESEQSGEKRTCDNCKYGYQSSVCQNPTMEICGNAFLQWMPYKAESEV